MHLDAKQTTDHSHARIDINTELIRHVYASVPKSLLTVAINSSILSLLLWPVVEHRSIIIWYAAILGYSFIRFLHYRNYRHFDNSLSLSRFWQRSILVNSIVSGALWGSAGLWLFPPHDIAHQVFLSFVIAGMSAGAVTTLSPVLKAAWIFVGFSMSPLVYQFFISGGDMLYAMAFMSLLFMLMLLSSARELNRLLVDSLVIRHERNKAVDVIERQALYDDLTGLPNRRFLLDQLKQDLARSIRHGYFGAVLFIDLDHFKAVNDSLGHAVGDGLLSEVAGRIGGRLRTEDTFGRLGGDEFVILISEAGVNLQEASERAQQIAEELLKLCNREFDIDGHEIHLTASIGIAMYPWKNLSSDDFLQRADVAMYQAKEKGRNSVRQFIPQMQRAVERRRAIEKGLRRALERDELKLYYQPIMDEKGEIVCAEALIRWHHPQKGVIGPVEFISIAEKTELIVLIGDWVLQTACRQLPEIIARHDMSISVNVSPRQFAEAEFHLRLEKLLAHCQIEPQHMRLEITEGMMLTDFVQTIEKIEFLKRLGLSFSVDDFGTGYSSLAYLKQLPIDTLKIDKSFVMNIDQDTDDAIIVETIIAMAKHLKIGVVAEGVESATALQYLKDRGCQNFQGYLFSRPLPYQDFLDLLSQQSLIADKAS